MVMANYRIARECAYQVFNSAEVDKLCGGGKGPRR